MCGVSHEVVDFGQKKKEVCGVAEEIFPDISNIQPYLIGDEVTHSSSYTYESDEEGIKDLEHFRKELDIYERELLEVQLSMKILDEEKKSLKDEILRLTQISDKGMLRMHFSKLRYLRQRSHTK